MMELHEENKLMREALEQIAHYHPDSPALRARRTLAAIDQTAAAQPEGEAAPQSNAGPNQGDYPIDRKIAAAPLPVYPPAPQAGDALGSIDTDQHQALMSDYMELLDRYNGHQDLPHRQARARLIAHIDASRREAYDKGRADGVGRAGDAQDGRYGAANWLRNNYQDHANIASLCDAMETSAPDAAPPASAAQQVPE